MSGSGQGNMAVGFMGGGMSGSLTAREREDIATTRVIHIR
jgi:hypothetical protein